MEILWFVFSSYSVENGYHFCIFRSIILKTCANNAPYMISAVGKKIAIRPSVSLLLIVKKKYFVQTSMAMLEIAAGI
ncbi:hypothetical protein ANAPH2_01160 [Anaplasma phagocytophilum]|nr:hypothetical protein ANAPH2_01160 [Anaplasma phagocytophilum]